MKKRLEITLSLVLFICSATCVSACPTALTSATPCTDQWLCDMEVLQDINDFSFEEASAIADVFFWECIALYY
ncbi:hypothetical protein [Flavobacterium sp. JP2137]|uniref:hypothetical protein n=1 Tax=Flavobacterium sp. JP2137 TaxID=3414510 RepID=UPI003D2FD33D